MGTLHRAQILLEQEQHEALVVLARQDERSISDLMREIVAQYLARRAVAERRTKETQALAALTAMRDQIQAQHGVIMRDLVAEARAEREHELEMPWQ